MSDQAPLLGQAQASDHVQAPEHTQAPEHAQAREQATAPEQAPLDSGHGHGEGAATAPLMSARGLGGSLLLYPNHIEIQHFGVLYLLVEFFSFHVPRMNVKILRNQITAIELMRPILLPDYLVISYAGAPHTTGGYLRRAFAPNALMMRYTENRDFFALLQRFGRDIH